MRGGGLHGYFGEQDCQWASRSVLKDFTEDALTFAALVCCNFQIIPFLLAYQSTINDLVEWRGCMRTVNWVRVFRGFLTV